MRTAMYALGPFHLDAEAEILFRNGEPLPVAKRAVALLRVLVEQAGAPVSKDALLEAAWTGLTVGEANLPVQIAAIRKVLGQEPGGDRWIETLPRRGYRFVGPVETGVLDSTVTVPAVAEISASGSGPTQSEQSIPQVGPERRLPDKPSIAVLPFTNPSGDPNEDYFSDGITEDIITESRSIPSSECIDFYWGCSVPARKVFRCSCSASWFRCALTKLPSSHRACCHLRAVRPTGRGPS